MAKLNAYFGTHNGDLKIYVGFFSVGSGDFSLLNDHEVDFAGSYEAFGQSGTFSIRIQLGNGDPAAVSGPCQVTLNGNTDAAAKYEVHGTKLTILTTLNPTPVSIYRNQNGTQIDGISGTISGSVNRRESAGCGAFRTSRDLWLECRTRSKALMTGWMASIAFRKD